VNAFEFLLALYTIVALLVMAIAVSYVAQPIG